MAAGPAVARALLDARRRFGAPAAEEAPRLGGLYAEPQRFEHQVGGHLPEKGKGGKPMMRADRFVLKPLQAKGRGHCEVQFYESLLRRAQAGGGGGGGEELVAKLCSFLPAYFGTVQLSEKQLESSCGLSGRAPRFGEGPTSSYILLEDLTAGFSRPCVVDLKMGRQTWGEDAHPRKVQRERLKYPPQERLGFRFTGMVVHRGGRQLRHDWLYGRTLDETNIADGFREFLGRGSEFRHDVAVRIKDRVRDIEAWFSQQSLFRFYSSSLLIVYEGDDSAAQKERIEARLIDFAHVFPIASADGRDDGYLLGLRSLDQTLDSLLAESREELRTYARPRDDRA